MVFLYGFIACSITFVILQAIHNLQIYIYISSDFAVTILRLVCRTVFRLQILQILYKCSLIRSFFFVGQLPFCRAVVFSFSLSLVNFSHP